MIPAQRETGNVFRRALAPRAGFCGRAFHLRFGPFALSQTVPGAWPFLLLLLHGPQGWRFAVALLLALKIMGGGVLVAWIVARFFPVIAGKNGLRARNFWGLAREVRWDEITRVAPIRWLIFTRFARLSTAQCRHIIWLPLFLEGQDEFERAVEKWAPPACALRQFFEARRAELTPPSHKR